MEIKRPSELADQLTYMEMYAPDNYPCDDKVDNAMVFGECFNALEEFANSCYSDEGREAVMMVKRNLEVAYMYYEDEANDVGMKTLIETKKLFRKARKFIRVSEE